MLKSVKTQLSLLREKLPSDTYRKGQALFVNGQCQTLSQGKDTYEFLIDDDFGDFQIEIKLNDSQAIAHTKGKQETSAAHLVAGLMQLTEELERAEPRPTPVAGKAYTREGMIRRVLTERREKALKAAYRMEFAANPYGEHILINEKGVRYKLTFHDLEAETGYCSCLDYRTNKLGTCKHLMYAYIKKKGKKQKLRKPRKPFPFVEIGLDPLNDYQIRWFHPDPDQIDMAVMSLIREYFPEGTHLPEDPSRIRQLLWFTQKVEVLYKEILIRPEVNARIEAAYEIQMMESIANNHQPDFQKIKASLYPYQRKGVHFAAYKKAVIIADEMGLGKTLQAITTAIVKKDAFGFNRTLIICPASLKNQWKNEIEKFSHEKAEIVEGKPAYRMERYRESEAFFLIINYETVLRDREAINKSEPDFIILDEAQRIKNYETVTARSIKSLEKKHALVITGTPIENRLIDLFSIMDFLDPDFLTPLWEFSYQHCYFDLQQRNKITGYYNLQSLKDRIASILLRRTKREVIQELPHVTQLDIPVEMHVAQQEYHTSFAKGIAKILRKKFITPYDMNRLMLLLNQMRMVCDSTFLIDKETNHSPKLAELAHILKEKLNLADSDRKVIIFSEWTRMNGLIGKLLRELGITFVELNGKVPVPRRQALVDKFYADASCKVFLSTEAGGTGLNLQVADTVINFELPWNPAKKNQRIGRIDRLGQTADQLTVINFITRDSIEIRIATGLGLKQSLFESVLDKDSVSDVVDFSEEGRAQFLQELQAVMDDMIEPGPADTEFVSDWEKSKESVERGAEADEGELEKLISEPLETATSTSGNTESTNGKAASSQDAETVASEIKDLEQVMNHGMNFLAGMFKMATGKDLATENQKIEIDKDTGEVVMRFKLPGLGT